eukprot:560330-Lingulodinium_polyedra.AAC.1
MDARESQFAALQRSPLCQQPGQGLSNGSGWPRSARQARPFLHRCLPPKRRPWRRRRTRAAA